MAGVLTLPFELRTRVGFDTELVSRLCGVVNDALLVFYERALRERVEPCWRSATTRPSDGASGKAAP